VEDNVCVRLAMGEELEMLREMYHPDLLNAAIYHDEKLIPPEAESWGLNYIVLCDIMKSKEMDRLFTVITHETFHLVLVKLCDKETSKALDEIDRWGSITECDDFEE
jgi:hypothetical protein